MQKVSVGVSPIKKKSLFPSMTSSHLSGRIYTSNCTVRILQKPCYFICFAWPKSKAQLKLLEHFASIEGFFFTAVFVRPQLSPVVVMETMQTHLPTDWNPSELFVSKAPITGHFLLAGRAHFDQTRSIFYFFWRNSLRFFSREQFGVMGHILQDQLVCGLPKKIKGSPSLWPTMAPKDGHTLQPFLLNELESSVESAGVIIWTQTSAKSLSPSMKTH
jgi:hypothetical protein